MIPYMVWKIILIELERNRCSSLRLTDMRIYQHIDMAKVQSNSTDQHIGWNFLKTNVTGDIEMY